MNSNPIPPGVRDFLAGRHSFYFATLSDAAWYRAATGATASGVRGEIRGPTGFLRVVDDNTIGWADLSGDLRDLRVGNIESRRGAALFSIDHLSGEHVEIFGRARIVHVDDEPRLIDGLSDRDRGAVELGIILTVDALDWSGRAPTLAARTGEG